MRLIYNRFIPQRGYKAITLFPYIFVRSECKDRFNEKDINHESIHLAQQKELLVVFFYIAYVAEWIYHLFVHPKTAYYSISFEREAYAHQNDLDYLKTRRRFAMWR